MFVRDSGNLGYKGKNKTESCARRTVKEVESRMSNSHLPTFCNMLVKILSRSEILVTLANKCLLLTPGDTVRRPGSSTGERGNYLPEFGIFRPREDRTFLP